MAAERHPVLVRLKDTDLVVAGEDADVRGRTMVDKDGQEIGKIDGLLVDPDEQQVRFLQVGSGGFLGIGEDKQLVPVDAVTAVEEDTVRIDQDREHVAGASVYDPKLEVPPEPDYVEGLYGHYGYLPYWSAGYRYPDYPFPRV